MRDMHALFICGQKLIKSVTTIYHFLEVFMRKQIFLVPVILFALILTANAQSYSVWFSSPTNYSYVSGSVINNQQSSIHLTFGWSGTKSNSQNVWKFRYSRAIIPGVESGLAKEVTDGYWTDENAPYGDLPAYVVRTNSFGVELYEEEPNGNQTLRASQAISVNVQQTVYIQNNFGTGTVSVNSTSYSSGAAFNLVGGESLTLDPIENQYDSEGYKRVWNASGTNNSDWKISIQLNYRYDYNRTYSYSANGSENGAIISGELRKVCNITYNGPVRAGTSYYYNSEPVPVVEGNPISVTALGKVSSDYIDMEFSSWSDGNTQNPRSYTTYSNTSYGINYVGLKPNNGYKNMQYTASTGQNIRIQWAEHPNTNVTQYQIWRRVKHNGVVGPETLIGTVGRGVLSYTDYEYLSTATYSDDLLWYDVRAYYSPRGTYADAQYMAVYGKESLVKMNESASTSEIPTEYSVGNYPNPFNPTTTIKYQLPEAGMVTLKVYDILGREVADLVNENKSAGYYEVNFDASKLTSGVYIYAIQAGKYTESKKMILAK